MKNVQNYTGQINAVRRVRSSINGNARFAVALHTDNGKVITFCTAVDSDLADDIKDYGHEGTKVNVEVGSHYRVATLNAIEKIS